MRAVAYDEAISHLTVAVELSPAAIVRSGMRFPGDPRRLCPLATLNQRIVRSITPPVSVLGAMEGLIVAAPTAGAAGVLPAILMSAGEFMEQDEDRLVDAMLIAGGVGLVLLGCAEPPKQVAPAPATHEPSPICEVSEWTHDVVSQVCDIGQKVVFLPNSWGNEQLPILFAAVNCDLRFEVVMSNGGVTCIYGPIEIVSKDGNDPADDAEDQQDPEHGSQ